MTSVTTTNTFLKNVGVHAELNAISQYLNTHPISNETLEMFVTYSPCVECALLILNLPGIRNVSYSLKYDDAGVDMLEKAGVNIGKLDPRLTQQTRPRSFKMHSYSQLAWAPNVTSVVLTQSRSSEVILSRCSANAFDVRPFITLALMNRNTALFRSRDTILRGSEEITSHYFHLTYKGTLNHREKLFLDVIGVNFT
jgi:tRNA(Arg) A34 adenosine deaminase TadA